MEESSREDGRPDCDCSRFSLPFHTKPIFDLIRSIRRCANCRTHRHMATHFPIWRQASQRRDSRKNLITFCIQLVPVRMLSKRWQAGEIKKAKVEALPPYRRHKNLSTAMALIGTDHPLWNVDDVTRTISKGGVCECPSGGGGAVIFFLRGVGACECLHPLRQEILYPRLGPVYDIPIHTAYLN